MQEPRRVPGLRAGPCVPPAPCTQAEQAMEAPRAPVSVRYLGHEERAGKCGHHMGVETGGARCEEKSLPARLCRTADRPDLRRLRAVGEQQARLREEAAQVLQTGLLAVV